LGGEIDRKSTLSVVQGGLVSITVFLAREFVRKTVVSGTSGHALERWISIFIETRAI